MRREMQTWKRKALTRASSTCSNWWACRAPALAAAPCTGCRAESTGSSLQHLLIDILRVLLQIRDNEFLQRENLLLEAFLAKVDFAKIGIAVEEDVGKVNYT